MIEIAPYRHLALAPLLAFAFASLLASVVMLASRADASRRRRVYLAAGIAGIVCAVASSIFWSTRHAGTGNHASWGWPRAVYTRWVSWEAPERHSGIRWQGIVENAVFYGAAAALIGSVGAVRRGHRAR